MNKILSDRVRRLMARQGLNMLGLSKGSGIGYASAHRLVNSGEVSLGVVERVARYFQIEPWQLLKPRRERK